MENQNQTITSSSVLQPTQPLLRVMVGGKNPFVDGAGVSLDHTLKVYDTTRLTLRNPQGRVVPCFFEPRTRWNGEVTDTRQPLNWLGLWFKPEGVGEYTLDDSGQNSAPDAQIRERRTGEFIAIETGALQVEIARTGTELLTRYVLGNAEQLGKAKPGITLSMAAKTRLRETAHAQQDFITVRVPQAFEEGSKVRFSFSGKIIHAGTDSTAPFFKVESGLLPIPPQDVKQRYIVGRGTDAKAEMKGYLFWWLPDTIYRAFEETNGTKLPCDGLPAELPENTGIEDLDAIEAGEYVITKIDGDKLYLDRPLTHRILETTEVLPVGEACGFRLPFTVQSAEVITSSPMHTIIKQVGNFNLSPYLHGAMYWYVYAGCEFVRHRFVLFNQTSDMSKEAEATDIAASGLSFSFGTAQPLIPSMDAVTVHSYVDGCASRRMENGEGNSTVRGNFGFDYCAVDFAANFPSLLTATASNLRHEWLPVLPDGAQHVVPRDSAKSWDGYLGIGAAQAVSISREAALRQPRETLNQMGAWPTLPAARREWKPEHFNGNARQAEAANQVERMLAAGYDHTQNDGPERLGMTPRSSLEQWKYSNDHCRDSNDNGVQFGRWIWGNSHERHGDKFTNNRYALGDGMGKAWLRTGDARAWRLMTIHCLHAATMGLEWSAKATNGNKALNQQGGYKYEKSNNGLAGLYESKPTHDWPMLGLYWMLTGDVLAYEALKLQRTRTHRIAANGVKGYLDWADFRAVRYGAKALESYLIFGKEEDLRIAERAYGELAAMEKEQGYKGYTVSPLPTDQHTSGIQLFNMIGYPADGLVALLLLKHSRNELDAAWWTLHSMLIRMVHTAVLGAHGRARAKDDAPMRFAQRNGDRIQLGGAFYYWRPKPIPGCEPLGNLSPYDATLLLHALGYAAFFARNAYVRLMAEQTFESLGFYRDLGRSEVAYDERQPISFRNLNFFGTSEKVYGQMTQAALPYLQHLERNAALNPPHLDSVRVIESGAAGGNAVLGLRGAGVNASCLIGVAGLMDLHGVMEGDELRVTIDGAQWAKLPPGEYPVIITAQNAGQSNVAMVARP